MSSGAEAACSSQPDELTVYRFLIYRFLKNTREEVRATLGSFHGRRVADFRVWTAGDGDAEQPTRKGLTLRVEQLPQLLEAVRAIIEATEAA